MLFPACSFKRSHALLQVKQPRRKLARQTLLALAFLRVSAEESKLLTSASADQTAPPPKRVARLHLVADVWLGTPPQNRILPVLRQALPGTATNSLWVFRSNLFRHSKLLLPSSLLALAVRPSRAGSSCHCTRHRRLRPLQCYPDFRDPEGALAW